MILFPSAILPREVQVLMGTPDQRSSERVVLVVDDEEMVCRYTARVLTDAGFRVLEAVRLLLPAVPAPTKSAG